MPRIGKNPGSSNRSASVKKAEAGKHKVPNTGRRGQAARDEAAVKNAGWHTPAKGRGAQPR